MELVVSKPANTSDEVSQRKITSLRLATDIEKSGALLNFNNTPIVVLMDQNDRKLFIAKQICNFLEYVNSAQTIEDNCKTSEVVSMQLIDEVVKTEYDKNNRCDLKIAMETPETSVLSEITTYKHLRGTVLIEERDLHALIFRSRKPEAQKFADFIFETVLPHLQKYGTYTKGMEHLNDTQKEEVSMVSADLVNKLTEENLLLKSDNQKLEQKINLLTMPKHLPMFLIKNEFESMYPCYNLKFWCMATYEFSKILLRKGLLRRHNKGWRLSPKGTQVFQDYATQISGSTNQPKVMYNQQMFKDFPEIREKLLDEIDILSQII